MSKLIFFIIFVVFILRKIAEASQAQQRQNRTGQNQRREEVELSEESLQAFLQQRKPKGHLPPPPPQHQRPKFAPGERQESEDSEVISMFRTGETPSTAQARGTPPPPPRPAVPQKQLPAFLQEIVAPLIESQRPRPPQPPPVRRRPEPNQKKPKERVPSERSVPRTKARKVRKMAGKSPFARLERLPLLQQAIIYKEVLGKPGGRSSEDF
ncbi:MAG: hypothetical protein O3B01_20275 [Planctomycetota bacterium]|nr:hypothetical protein [Planctomycetota bacterium]MDA1140908.1 hypothetical protein [Planctomycetota bacterium]